MSDTPKPSSDPKASHLVSPPSEADLRFKRKPMVHWFDPRQLAGTGLQAVLSTVFGSYADKREVQPILEQSSGKAAYHDPFRTEDWAEKRQGKEVWVDYLADTGDGFQPSFGMAYLLGQKELTLQGPGVPKGGLTTPRADMLILGGDLVYPTASREEYWNRFNAPFSFAFPKDSMATERPKIFAIPGNHDWYDGLNSFLKLFCQSRTIGGWQTMQQRSYFAIKLCQNRAPGDPDAEGKNVWLWGIDIQLDVDIDSPQLDYFKRIVINEMKDGDQVVLCTAEPSWVYKESYPESNSFNRLRFFQKRYIRKIIDKSLLDAKKEGKTVEPIRLELLAVLTGDLHHYSRYSGRLDEGDRPVELITAGGGGAFLHPTHNLPTQVNLSYDTTPASETSGAGDTQKPVGIFDQQKIFPGKPESRKLALRGIMFPFKNFVFASFLALFYVLLGWVMESAAIRIPGEDPSSWGKTLFEKLAVPGLGLGEVFSEIWHTLAYSPLALFLSVGVVIGMVSFADRKNRKKKTMLITGTIHGFVQVFLAFAWLYLAVNLNVNWLPEPFKFEVGSASFILLFTLEMIFVGGIGGGLVMGFYLTLTNLLFGVHDNELFSALRVKDYKNFLRMKIADGKLTIYPIAVWRMPRKWRYQSKVRGVTSWFEPTDVPEFKTKARLIEEPIVIDLAGKKATRV